MYLPHSYAYMIEFRCHFQWHKIIGPRPLKGGWGGGGLGSAIRLWFCTSTVHDYFLLSDMACGKKYSYEVMWYNFIFILKTIFYVVKHNSYMVKSAFILYKIIYVLYFYFYLKRIYLYGKIIFYVVYNPQSCSIMASWDTNIICNARFYWTTIYRPMKSFVTIITHYAKILNKQKYFYHINKYVLNVNTNIEH